MSGARHPEPGDVNDMQKLLPQVYDNLRQLADQWFAEQPLDHTLQPTALVHEAYVRLADRSQTTFRSRTHFFALAARAMRQILVDHSRRRAACKRGGAWTQVTLSEESGGTTAHVDLDDLNTALARLEQLNPRQCRIVELRFLAGLSVAETAEALNISTRTVKLDWRMARAWLLEQLRSAR